MQLRQRKKKTEATENACDVLHIICKDGGSYTHRICNGERQFVLEMDMLNLENFNKLLPKFHLRGMNLLIENGLFFADHDGSSKKATDTGKQLETSLATTSSMNANKSAAKKQHTIENLKQKKITAFC